MSRAQRRNKERELIRENIMNKALELIISDGYEGFSMRKLSARLGIAAKTIYNYFQNQDELYLCLLTKGFEQLFDNFTKAIKQHKEPIDQIRAAITVYIEFGIKNSNIYNLMFTWHVPKFNDYSETPMESVARYELNAALKCAHLIMDLVRDYTGNLQTTDENELQLEFVQAWSYMHGYVAGINNTLLNYLHLNPLSLKKLTIDRVFQNTQLGLDAIRQRHGLL